MCFGGLSVSLFFLCLWFCLCGFFLSISFFKKFLFVCFFSLFCGEKPSSLCVRHLVLILREGDCVSC